MSVHKTYRESTQHIFLFAPLDIVVIQLETINFMENASISLLFKKFSTPLEHYILSPYVNPALCKPLTSTQTYLLTRLSWPIFPTRSYVQILYLSCELQDLLYLNNTKLTFYSVLWPTNTQIFHRLSHYYMFRHYRVIFRELVINTLPSYMRNSNAVVGNKI